MTKPVIFEPLDLLSRGESVKMVLVKVVELCEIYNFALGSNIKFVMVSKLQSSKVVHLKQKSAFWT